MIIYMVLIYKSPSPLILKYVPECFMCRNYAVIYVKMTSIIQNKNRIGKNLYLKLIETSAFHVLLLFLPLFFSQNGLKMNRLAYK